MRESVVGKTTRCAEDEGEAAGYLWSCKAARAAPNRIGRAKPKEAAHRDVDYEAKKFSMADTFDAQPPHGEG
jgi:hypothetical protein